jgi:very-short-patch-repair endonuclease
MAISDPGCSEGLVDLEVDGRAAHETRAARERDRARDAHLTALGWRVLRFTWFQVNHRPDWVAEMVRKALAVAGR